MYDISIFHAVKDSDVATALDKNLTAGDLLVSRDKFPPKDESASSFIKRSLVGSRYCVVLLSTHFLDTYWPKHESRDLFAQEISRDERILPLSIGLSQSGLEISPRLKHCLDVNSPNIIQNILNIFEPGRGSFTDPDSKLTVTFYPILFQLHTGVCPVKTPIRILNRSKHSIFEIVVKLKNVTRPVLSTSIEIVPDVSTTSLQENAARMHWANDLLVLDRSQDKDNQEITIIVRTLGPNQSMKFVVQGTDAIRSSAEVAVLSFTKEMQSSSSTAISSLVHGIQRVKRPPRQAQQQPMKRFFHNVVWPAVAGNVAWAFFTVLVQGTSSNTFWDRVIALLAVFIYLAADWCTTEAVFEDINPFYWIADAFIAPSIAIFAITTQSCPISPPEGTEACSYWAPGAIMVAFFAAGLGHLVGAWDIRRLNTRSSWCERGKLAAFNALGLGIVMLGFTHERTYLAMSVPFSIMLVVILFFWFGPKPQNV